MLRYQNFKENVTVYILINDISNETLSIGDLAHTIEYIQKLASFYKGVDSILTIEDARQFIKDYAYTIKIETVINNIV